jgi:hypothetical protein
MSTADEFLEAAQALLDHSSASSGHWRRAISTAYYAAFHAVVEASTDLLFSSQAGKTAAREWFEHSGIAYVAEALRHAPTDSAKQANWVRDHGKLSGLDHLPGIDHRRFGERLRDLYTKRTQADYFALQALGLSEGDAYNAVADARAVCAQVQMWHQNGDPDFELIALWMLRKSLKRPQR